MNLTGGSGTASYFRFAQMLAMLLLTFGGNAIAQQSESGQPAKPFLLVEGWWDRNYVSDLYTLEMSGKPIKRLTSEPLPTNRLVAVAPGTGDPYFVANAMALYRLSLRGNILASVHSQNIGAIAISANGSTAAIVVSPDVPPGGAYVSPAPGRALATTDPPLNLRVTPSLAGSTWRPVQFPLPAGVAPTEMTFTPDGEHVLITHWAGGRNAQLLLVDLKSGTTRTVLAADGVSYYGPAFAPDGKSLLAVREDLTAGRWAIVSLAWRESTAPAVILTAPRGVSLSTPIFLADGRRFLFQQNDALARATLDGKTIDALFGNLEQKDREWRPGLVERRGRSNRASWIPQVVTRYFARVVPRERETPTADPTADLVVIDVQTGQRTMIPLPSNRIKAAVVVE